MNSKSIYGMIQGNLGLIFLQFIIGSYISIYISLPPEINFMKYLSSYPSVALHAVLGFLIFLISIVVLIGTRGMKRGMVAGSAVAFVGVILAIIGGLEYLNSNLNPGFSFMMSLGFIISVSGYMMAIIAYFKQ